MAGAFPLLPDRYHLAASGVEGVALRLSAQDGEHWSQFRLSRTGTHIDNAPTYPPLVCRNCGEPYIEAWDDGSTLHPRSDIRPNSRRRVLRLTAAGAVAGELDDDVDDAIDAEAPFDFNPKNGMLEDGPGDGILSLEPAIMRE